MRTAHSRLRCARMRSHPTDATDPVSLVREECACREAIWLPERSEPEGPQGAALYNRRSELAAANIGTNCYGYAYDTIGNRLWSAENATTNTYTANNLNQYTSILRTSASPCEITHAA